MLQHYCWQLQQTSQLTILVCSEILRYLIHTKFRYSSTVTSSYCINKRQNMAWRKLIINNRQKKLRQKYSEYTAGTQTIGHVRSVRGQKFTRDINFIRPLTQDRHGTARVRTIEVVVRKRWVIVRSWEIVRNRESWEVCCSSSISLPDPISLRFTPRHFHQDIMSTMKWCEGAGIHLAWIKQYATN